MDQMHLSVEVKEAPKLEIMHLRCLYNHLHITLVGKPGAP